jgi:glycosyltransferase involved in cell wall biosynthesis
MCQALNAGEVQAEILTTNDAGEHTLPFEPGQFIQHGGVSVCFLPRWSPRLNAAREFQYSPALIPWLRSHLASYAGIHVHALFSHLPTQSMTLARSLGVSYIVRPLGLLDPWSLAQGAWKKRWYLRLFERANLEGACAIHCTSDVEAANVRRLLPRARTKVIPHGIAAFEAVPDADAALRARFRIPESHHIFLFLSRWHPKKNIPLLLQALRQLPNKDWTLILAGDGTADYKASIHAEIEAGELSPHVICPGHVSGELKATLLQGADTFVLPSESENFGISVAEALVNGLRCVVTQGVDLAPTVQALDGGSVCEPSVNALAASLQQELQKPRRAGSELSARAQSHFSWSVPAAQLAGLYRDLFVTPSPHPLP